MRTMRSMDKRQFFEKVALMRETQKEYFQPRSRKSLKKSKALEAEIDREIQRVRAMGFQAQPQPQQPTLFLDDDINRPAVPNDLYQH